MRKDLKIYNATVDDEGTGMFVVSLVEDPAVEIGWQLFEKAQEMFKVENEDKQVITGVVMLAGVPIYRRDSQLGEYYIQFSRETIEKMTQKFLKEGYQENVDTSHSFNMIDGIELQQIFIKDTEKGISPAGFENVPDGSLFFTYKVTSDELWDKVKNGSWTGFSLAGSFGLEEEEDEEYKEVMDLIDKLSGFLK